MKMQFGILEESYKYVAGQFDNENDKEYICFCEEEDKDSEIKSAIKWGKDIFNKKSIQLIAGKNDWVAFQVALKDNQSFTVNIGDNPNFSTYGDLTSYRISANSILSFGEISMKNIGLVEDDDGLYKSDILLSNEVVTVPSRRVQLIWVELKIPKETKAGTYSGQVDIYEHKMFFPEKAVGTLDFSITVKNVLLPSPKDYKFHLDLWQHNSNIARKHEVPLWSEEHFVVIERYIKTLADLGQKAITIIASEIPWSGQRCFADSLSAVDLFEYSMIKVIKNSKGEFEYDFSIVDKYIDLCFRCGIDKEISVFGLVGIWIFPEYGYGKVALDYLDAIRIRYFDKKTQLYYYIDNAKDVKAYISSIEKHFIKRNLIDKVRVIADEPANTKLYKQRLEVLKEIAPSFKFKTAINHASFINEFKNNISDFVPIMSCVSEEFDLLKEIKDETNSRFLWYVCCIPEYPNTFIKSHLLECRLIGYLTAYMNFDGFLRWNYTVWSEKPRDSIRCKSPHWKAGDTHFVYPASNGSPLLSVRYKNLKRGIQEYEIIRMLESKNKDKILEEIWSKILKEKDVRKFFKNKGMQAEDIFNLKHSIFEKIREVLLTELEGL